MNEWLKMSTKQEIFNLFYGPRQVCRSGGGTVKSKMTRLCPTFEEQATLKEKIKADKTLIDYYEKLLLRDPNLAPPPKPPN